MAEIKIEKKSPKWPYILIALVVVLVIAFVWYNNYYDTNDLNDDTTPERVDDDVDDMSMIMAGENDQFILLESHS